MATEWREHPLGDLVESFDPLRVPVKEADRRPGPYPYYGASGVVDQVDEFLFDGEYLLIAEDGENLRTRNTPVAFMARGKFWVNNHAHIVRGNSEADTRFLMYAIAASDISGYLTGSTMPKLTQGNLNRIPLRVPPVREQRSIAHILGTLDDKIELNQRMSETLEAMARALFKPWLDAQPQDRVPVAELVAEGVLEIGDGYRAKNDELAFPGLPFIRAGDLQRGIRTQGADVLRQASVDRAGSKVSRSGDVAFTSKGTIGRFARVSRQTPQCVYSPQVCYWRSLDSAALHPAVLYAWMTSEDLASQIAAVSGQTDMAPYVSLSDQRRMEIPRFSTSQDVIGQRLEALFSRQDDANAESQIIASIRDALLPGLITGELRPAALSGRTSHLARG